MNEAQYSTDNKLLAMRVYRYFLANPNMLEKEENKLLFEKARTKLLHIHQCELDEHDMEALERALQMVAHWENKTYKDDFKIDENVRALLEN